MEGVAASILQSAQNVKVKLLSIIRGVSTVKLLLSLPTFRTPSPYPKNLSGTRWERGGFGWGIYGRLEMQEKK